MGSGGSSVDYQMSPEQRQLLTSISPLVQGLASYGVNNMTYGNPSDSQNFVNQIYGNMVAPPQAPYQPPAQRPGWADLAEAEGRGGGQFNGGTNYYGGSGGGTTGTASEDAYNSYLNEYRNYMGNFQSSSPVTNLGAPQAPNMPSMTGLYSGVPLYNTPNAVMPTADWYNNLSPEVLQGAWAPYDYAANQLTEQLNSAGQGGNARGGYSGAAGAALGELYSRGAKDVGMQAWQMSQPGMMVDYATQLERNQLGYNNLINERYGNYQNEMNRINQNYNTNLMSWQMPYSLLGMTPQLLPTGIVQNEPNRAGNAFGGAASGAMAGTMVSPGYGTAIGGLVGLLGGLMGS
jgi:hypothetical protein